MKPFLVQEYKFNIIDLVFLEENNLGVIHRPNAFRILSKDKQYKMIVGMSVKSETFRETTQAVAISEDGSLIASGENPDNILNIISLNTKTTMYKMSKHSGEIQSIVFDPMRRYIISGGVDGQVLLWGMNTGDYIGRLPAHGDYVSTMAISKEGLFAITGAYNGTICINNLNTASKPKRVKLGDYRINRIVFISENRALIATSSNEVVMMDYLRHKIIKRIKTTIDNINGIASTMNDRYLMVSGASLKVPVYDMETAEQISPHMIVVGDEITRMAFNPEDNLLVISTKDGRIYFHDISDDKELKELIDKHEYKDAYELAASNPLFQYSEQYKRLEEIWNTAYQNAILLLRKNLKEQAEKVLEPFKGILFKDTKIALLLKDFREYQNFKQLVNDKKYARAYSIAESAPSIKETADYAKLEKIWEQAYERAKKVLINEEIGVTPKSILQEFSTVTAKMGLVQALTRNAGMYVGMIEALREKNFKAFFNVVAQNKALMKTKEYESAMAVGEWYAQQIKEKLAQKDFKTAVELLETLRQFHHMHEQIEEAEMTIKAARHFFHFLKSENITNCYKLIDDYPVLLRYPEAQNLEKEWQDTVVEMEEEALKGNARPIIDLYQKFSELHERYGKISSLLKLAYLTQLKIAINRKYRDEKSYNKAFKIYSTLFGFDMDLADISEFLAEKLEIDILMKSSKEVEEKNIIQSLEQNKEKIPSTIIPYK